jgi:hypothetical protein
MKSLRPCFDDSGPVLLEAQAAGELFLQTVGASLTGNPRTVVDDVRFEGMFSANGGLNDKIGSRVLPDSVSLKVAPSGARIPRPATVRKLSGG